MSTPFTIWHYLSFIIIFAILLVAIIYTLRQADISRKGSYITTYCVVTLLLLLFSIIAINGYTKQVIIVSLENHRFLSTESIIYTGTVRNVGNYDVGQVEIEIEIYDKGLKNNSKLFQKPTAFKDHYNDTDIRKLFGFDESDAKPVSFIIRKTVAKELKAREAKQFAVSIDHPSHFSGYSSEERLIVR